MLIRVAAVICRFIRHAAADIFLCRERFLFAVAAADVIFR